MARPIVVGVGGDSGAGKSTLCEGLKAIFGAGRIVEVCLDDYHAFDRAQRKAAGLTALNPRANDLAAMEADLCRLARGETVSKPVYDHRDGTFGAREAVTPNDIVLVHGLFPLYTRRLRSLFDVSVWLDPQIDVKVAWKVLRDTSRRGYTEDQVRAEIAARQPDIDAYIAPQRRHADLRLSFLRPAEQTDDARLDARIILGGRFPSPDDHHFASRSTHLRRIEGGDGPFPRTIIELDGDIDDGTAVAVQAEIRRTMGTRHVGGEAGPVGAFSDARGTRVSHPLAIAQLLIARRICRVLDERAGAVAA